jgi:hypothetical protein
MHNTVGQVVRTERFKQASTAGIPLKGLAAGVYFIRVQDGDAAVATLRLMVE